MIGIRENRVFGSRIHDTQNEEKSCRRLRSWAMQAMGLVETKGLVGLLAATDAMLKAANVQILKRIDIGRRWTTAGEGQVAFPRLRP
jgi:hypothetical protein